MVPGSKIRSARTSLLVFAGAFAIFLVGLLFCLRVTPWTVDDAYIAFRYAENIAHGFGPVFNRGGPPVEGFTSPLWVLLLAAGARLLGGENLPALATGLGLLCYLGTLIVLCRREGSDDRRLPAGTMISRLLPAGLWILSKGAVHYAVTGLETEMFVLVVLLFHGAIAGRVSPWLGYLSAACAIWVRPEGPWLIAAGVVQLVALSNPEPVRRIAIRMGLVLILSGLAGLVVRWICFHDVLPNTYYAKRSTPGAGLQYLWTSASGGVLTIVGAGLLGALLGTSRERAWFATGLAWVAAVVLEGGDWMVNARFLQPALALFALSAGGLSLLVRGGQVRQALTAAACALLLIPGVAGARQAGVDGQYMLSHYDEAQRAFVKWIRATHVHSIALIDIGMMGYAAPELMILDLDGLTDARLGHQPGGELKKQIDPSYVFDEKRPEMIVLRILGTPWYDEKGKASVDGLHAQSVPEAMVLGSPRLKEDYDLIFAATVAVYLRHGVTVPPEAIPQHVIDRAAIPSERGGPL